MPGVSPVSLVNLTSPIKSGSQDSDHKHHHSHTQPQPYCYPVFPTIWRFFWGYASYNNKTLNARLLTGACVESKICSLCT